MPGIVGVFAQGPADAHQRQVSVMLRTLLHEPFYLSGLHSYPDLGLYTGWVAHEGSYAARQSTIRDFDDLSLTFAGECFPDVTHGQSETFAVDLLANYRSQGPDFVARLNGLFAGVVIDRRRHIAILFNDRYAAERIYVHEAGHGLYFASEAKALLAVIKETRCLDDEGVAEVLAYGSTSESRTLFRNVNLVPGGSVWSFEFGRQPLRRKYFQARDWELQTELPDKDFERQFVSRARAILPLYARGPDVVGISVTGGLDTRMIMACLPDSQPKPICYTFGALRGETLDVRIGRRVSRAIGLEHRTLRVKDEFLSNYGAHVDRTVRVTDGTAGALVAHELFLNRIARSVSPIRLTGNFGSEILRSTSTLAPRRLAPGLINPAFRPVIDRVLPRGSPTDSVTQSAFREVPLHLFGSMAAARSQLTFRTPYLDNALVELAYRASTTARKSPEAALKLIAAANPALAGFPTDRGLSAGGRGIAGALRRLFGEVTFKLDYLDKEGLSGVFIRSAPLFALLGHVGLMGLHKFLPYRTWFRRELAEYVADVVATTRTQSQGYWNRSFLRTMAEKHVMGRANYIKEIGSVLTIEAVQRLLVEGWRIEN